MRTAHGLHCVEPDLGSCRGRAKGLKLIGEEQIHQRRTPVLEYFSTDAYLRRNPIVPIRARLVSELLADLQGARVLDLGCGDGSVSRLLLANNHLTLVDLSEAMLERARQAGGSTTRYVQADALTWRPDDTYDAVLCIGLVAHVDSPRRLLEQVAAAIRPGGRCVIQITDAGSCLGWLQTRYSRHRRREGYPLNEFTRQQLAVLAAEHELTPIADRRYGLLLPGTGHLPQRWQAWLEERFTSGALSLVSAEVLVVFKKSGAAPHGRS